MNITFNGAFNSPGDEMHAKEVEMAIRQYLLRNPGKTYGQIQVGLQKVTFNVETHIHVDYFSKYY